MRKKMACGVLPLLFPPKLKPGDMIGIVAPAFSWTQEALEQCTNKLNRLGYAVRLGACASGLQNLHGYQSGSEKERAAELNQMFADPEVKAIFCVRGGYGTSRILPFLDYELIRANPKIFMGYSDITNLHMAIYKMTGLVTFHGPMLVPNIWKDMDPYTVQSQAAALNMGLDMEFYNPQGERFSVIHPGKAKGILTGGNLSVITRAIGTFYEPETQGKLLFLEEVDESIPKLDVMITQMEHAGMMNQVRGILLGDFTGCTNQRYEENYSLEGFFQERFAGYSVPIMSHVRSGHGKPMGTIPLGMPCELNADTMTIRFSRNFPV